MRPEDVPAEIVDLYRRRYTGTPSVAAHRRALAAVLTAHERMVREQVAADIEAEADRLAAEGDRLDKGDRDERLDSIGYHAEAGHLRRGASIARRRALLAEMTADSQDTYDKPAAWFENGDADG